jgi:hypothetical protein
MEELVPFTLGAVLGALIALTASGRTRVPLCAAAVVWSAAVATVLSSEYRTSWAYILLDCAEAALGLALGLLAALVAKLPAWRNVLRTTRRSPDACPMADTEGRDGSQ